ncbi:hypothetical protein FUA48_12180 [Flavobacterium alkalisoli]|uniref:Lipocalin family protein n=1 Tax=Flavobacterium alkalisoli TaxID=2602769 RepID=A0A5B9FWC5_9FLAO|nr:hypothetical protein [Flavobacterium alkalisoli]QEE50306.1 hypothetical protein FUA48_12180 [Flavobacterium alkalisoli]
MKKLNKHYMIGAVLIIFLSCSFVKQDKNIIYQRDIIGTWLLNKKQVNYPQLTFSSDNTCIFTSMGDTLYRFKYEVKGNELILEDVLKQVSRNKIISLTRTTLIFEKLVENNSKQVYTRKKD